MKASSWGSASAAVAGILTISQRLDDAGLDLLARFENLVLVPACFVDFA
jgi:hypothetical protein